MLLRRRVSLLTAVTLTVLAVCSAPAHAQKHGDDDPDLTEIRNYHLTMPKVDQFVAATTALKAMVDANPDLKKQMDSGKDDDASITQKAADWDLHFPQAAAVVKSKGLSTREYIVVSIALLNDVMIVGMKKNGSIKEYPPNTITAENAAFVEQNYDKLEHTMSALMSMNQDSNQQ
jgi:hypothetical protein